MCTSPLKPAELTAILTCTLCLLCLYHHIHHPPHRHHQVLHVGDRFSDTGNDTATRDCCSIVWVANPEETGFFIKMLLKDIKSRKHMGYIE